MAGFISHKNLVHFKYSASVGLNLLLMKNNGKQTERNKSEQTAADFNSKFFRSTTFTTHHKLTRPGFTVWREVFVKMLHWGWIIFGAIYSFDKNIKLKHRVEKENFPLPRVMTQHNKHKHFSYFCLPTSTCLFE